MIDGLGEPRPSGRAVLLATVPDHTYAVLHTPPAEARHATAVLIVPPFGWPEVCSYRARRLWATRLAQAGFPAARIDLPGCGDSGGSPRAPARVEAWADAVAFAARWLRTRTGAGRVAAIGIGSGGLLACLAASADDAIDDLILWGVPVRGATLVRELRAHAAAVRAMARGPRDAGAAQPVHAADGTLELAGFALTAATAASLASVDLEALVLARAADRRVLLLGNDGRGVDERLREHLECLGAPTTVIQTRDYAALMAHPQAAQRPAATIGQSIEWLRVTAGAQASAVTDEGPDGAGGAGGVGDGVARMQHGGQAIAESVIELPGYSGRLTGILSRPASASAGPVGAVFVNAGTLRRTGPSRLWVELARSWAARGVPSVRIDLEGLGDSDGDERAYVRPGGLYAPAMLSQVLELPGRLQAAGVAERFVMIGMCSGAHLALQAALREERVVAAILLNLYAFHWTERLVRERDRRLAVGLIGGGVLERIREHGLPRNELARALRALRQPRPGPSEEAVQSAAMAAAFDELAPSGGPRVLMLFSEGEPMYGQLERAGQLGQEERWPNVTVEQIPSHDHELRALWVQDRLRERLDRAIDELVAALEVR